MDVSDTVCTYNRCENVNTTLQSLLPLNVRSNLAWELLVVDDNNSTDITKVLNALVAKALFPVVHFSS